MSEENLRVLLIDRRDIDQRNSLLLSDKLLLLRAEIKIELSGKEHCAVLCTRATLDDFHVQAVLGISAVGYRLIEATVISLGEPISTETDFVE